MYRYFLHINTVRIPVTPYELAKVKLVSARERDQVFFREKLNGAVVLRDAAFQLLLQVENSVERCTELKFEIEWDCSGFWERRWIGYFSCNDVKWNLSKCSASFTPMPDDEYRPVLENYSKEFNILPATVATTATTRLNFVGEFEFLQTTYNSIPDEDEDTWAPFINADYWVDGDWLSKGSRNDSKIWFRLIRYELLENGEAIELSGGGWKVIDTTETQAKYAKRPDLYEFEPYDWNSKGNFTKYPDLVQVPCNEPYDTEKYIDVTSFISGNLVANGCINLRYDIFSERWVKILWEFGSFTYDRNRWFTDVLRFLVSSTATPDLLPADNTVLSRFFNEPVNYVTGKPNTLTRMQVASLSDVIGYKTSEPATRAEWSLKKITEALRNMFRVYWDIHEGRIRFEHESFYQLQGVKDLTQPAQYVRGTDVYEYEKEKMPRYQRLLFSNALNRDFEKGEIEYGGICVTKEDGQDSEDNTVADVTTDLEYLVVSGGSTGQKGFVLMLVNETGSVLKETGDRSLKEMPNAGLSAANLIRDYYTHNRVLENGLVNQNIRIFESVRKTKKQIALTLPVCCERVNPYSRFISTLGDKAELETMSFNLAGGTMEYVLLHETTGTGALELGRQFDDSFDDSFN